MEVEDEKVNEMSKYDEIKWSQMKIINLFNLDLKDENLNDLLNKILLNLSEDPELLNMTKNCETLSLCKNKLSLIVV